MMGVTGASMVDGLERAAEEWRRWRQEQGDPRPEWTSITVDTDMGPVTHWAYMLPPPLTDEEWAVEQARERQAEDAAVDARMLGDDREWNRLNP